MLIINCINILFVVPFKFTASGIEFNLVKDNDEYFELLSIKQTIYKILGRIDNVGTITLSAEVAVGDTIEQELRAIDSQTAYDIYIKQRQSKASGGARKKLTKKRRKKSGQTKNKRQKRQRKYSLRKRKSKAKQSRRKRRQYRK